MTQHGNPLQEATILDCYDTSLFTNLENPEIWLTPSVNKHDTYSYWLYIIDNIYTDIHRIHIMIPHITITIEKYSKIMIWFTFQVTSRDAKNIFLLKKSLARPDKAKQGPFCQEQGPEQSKHVQEDLACIGNFGNNTTIRCHNYLFNCHRYRLGKVVAIKTFRSLLLGINWRRHATTMSRKLEWYECA